MNDGCNRVTMMSKFSNLREGEWRQKKIEMDESNRNFGPVDTCFIDMAWMDES